MKYLKFICPKLFFLLSLLILTGCNKDEEEDTVTSFKYSCINGDCEANTNGQYVSLVECQNNCNDQVPASGCDFVQSNENSSCNPGFFPVFPGRCCPEDFPYTTDNCPVCWATCELAADACFGEEVYRANIEGLTGSTNYNCVNGNCVESSNGLYSSFGQCQEVCGGAPTQYNCVNGNCIESSNGLYSSLGQCQEVCGGAATQYNCVNGSCVASSNGQYSSLGACQAACVDDSGYNCVNGDCQFVSTGATFSSLSACNNNCSQPTGQLMVWNSNSTPCPAGAGNTISVYINGSFAGGLSNYFQSVPACGTPGTITQTLPPGTYSVSASCGSTSWGPGNWTVSAGGCFKLELN